MPSKQLQKKIWKMMSRLFYCCHVYTKIIWREGDFHLELIKDSLELFQYSTLLNRTCLSFYNFLPSLARGSVWAVPRFFSAQPRLASVRLSFRPVRSIHLTSQQELWGLGSYPSYTVFQNLLLFNQILLSIYFLIEIYTYEADAPASEQTTFPSSINCEPSATCSCKSMQKSKSRDWSQKYSKQHDP